MEPGDGSLPRSEAIKDQWLRRWDVVTPSATLIGRPRRPDEEVSENLRRLHEERHQAMKGHSERMHRLDKVRITHAFCNALDVTSWERDRALGIMIDLDLTAFGSQRAIPKVALVVIQFVVDHARRERQGLVDREWVRSQPPDRLEELYDRYSSIKESQRFRELIDEHGLDVTGVNRLTNTLREQIDEQDLGGVAFGRSPHRDPSLSPLRPRRSSTSPNPDGDPSPPDFE